MGVQDCQIILDNPWNSYCPGDTINGKVEYTLDSPIIIRGIYIQFRGLAETSWLGTPVSERRNTDRANCPKIPYVGDEEYFNITYYILGSKSGCEMEIPPGQHSYPFTCALPPSLPSSFEEEFGRVRYTIKTTLDRPMKFDEQTELLFTVVNSLDLNANPENMKPIHMQMETNFCCFCCKTGPLVLDAHVPISGFCPGQTVPIEISCENGSNVDVDSIRVEIRKIMHFRTQIPTSESRNKTEAIARLGLSGVSGNSSMNWKEMLEIPPNPPPANLAHCGLIDVYYDLMVTAVTSGCHLDLEDSAHITLGTVPLVGYEGLPTSDAVVEGGVQPGVEMSLLANAPGMPYPGQMQPPPGVYDQQQPPPGVYGQQQPPPGVYGQQQPPPGAYGQPQPMVPGWVNPQTGQPAMQQTGGPQNPYATAQFPNLPQQ